MYSPMDFRIAFLSALVILSVALASEAKAGVWDEVQVRRIAVIQDVLSGGSSSEVRIRVQLDNALGTRVIEEGTLCADSDFATQTDATRAVQLQAKRDRLSSLRDSKTPVELGFRGPFNSCFVL